MRVRIQDDETVDDLLHGELKLIQKQKGYRYSVDALLLCNFVLPLKDEDVIDIGTGSGVIPLILAKRGQPRKITGVEIQTHMADMAIRNAILNGMENMINIVAADANNMDLPGESFDLVLSNPPFRPKGSGQVSPLTEKAIARHEIYLSLSQLLDISKNLARQKGRICIVFPFDQEKRLNQSIKKAGLFPSRIQTAYDRPGKNPRLILIEMKKQNPGEIIQLPDLPIQTDEGKFSLDGYK